MPPHCDSMDGPVVRAARQALEAGDVTLILPYVPKAGEDEVIRAFRRVIPVRKDGALARDVADLYFFETVVRIHRAGEGAPYTGLKPAGLDVGPVIPVAEQAIETGSPDELVSLLSDTVRAEVMRRFDHVMHLQKHAQGTVDETREYVGAMLGLQVYAHHLYLRQDRAARGRPRADALAEGLRRAWGRGPVQARGTEHGEANPTPNGSGCDERRANYREDGHKRDRTQAAL